MENFTKEKKHVIGNRAGGWTGQEIAEERGNSIDTVDSMPNKENERHSLCCNR